jgi:hypothetical protein
VSSSLFLRYDEKTLQSVCDTRQEGQPWSGSEKGGETNLKSDVSLLW